MFPDCVQYNDVFRATIQCISLGSPLPDPDCGREDSRGRCLFHLCGIERHLQAYPSTRQFSGTSMYQDVESFDVASDSDERLTYQRVGMDPVANHTRQLKWTVDVHSRTLTFLDELALELRNERGQIFKGIEKLDTCRPYLVKHELYLRLCFGRLTSGKQSEAIIRTVSKEPRVVRLDISNEYRYKQNDHKIDVVALGTVALATRREIGRPFYRLALYAADNLHELGRLFGEYEGGTEVLQLKGQLSSGEVERLKDHNFPRHVVVHAQS